MVLKIGADQLYRMKKENEMSEEKIDPGHNSLRDVLRILGPIALLIGLALIGVGMVSFFSAFGGMKPPKYFWCAFIGMPISALGIFLCKFGYMGKVARYVAGEIAPVGKDTINYMAKGTQEGVKAVASAIIGSVRHINFLTDFRDILALPNQHVCLP